MKSENIEPQNTQKYAEIYNGSREGQEKSFCVFSRCLRLKKQENTQQNAKKRNSLLKHKLIINLKKIKV